MKRNPRILPRAERDAQSIFEWLAERSPDGAARWALALEAAVEKVAERPESYGLAPEDDYVNCELRQFLFNTRSGRMYRGLFSIVGDQVRILRVRGPGQPALTEDELSEE